MTYGRFWLTAVSVNWGRGYEPGEFRRNVETVLEFTDGRENVVILPQELDEEPDPANEHERFASMLEEGTTRVHWSTREPIILSPSFEVVHRARVKTMGSGLEIGGPTGTGPARYVTTCIAKVEGIHLAFANTHPHRDMDNEKVQAAREDGQRVLAGELLQNRAYAGGTSGVWGADMNDRHVPRLVPGEKVAEQKGLDHLRYWQHPQGARLELVAHGSLNGTIDPHDPIWARFLVTAR